MPGLRSSALPFSFHTSLSVPSVIYTYASSYCIRSLCCCIFLVVHGFCSARRLAGPAGSPARVRGSLPLVWSICCCATARNTPSVVCVCCIFVTLSLLVIPCPISNARFALLSSQFNHLDWARRCTYTSVSSCCAPRLSQARRPRSAPTMLPRGANSVAWDTFSYWPISW